MRQSFKIFLLLLALMPASVFASGGQSSTAGASTTSFSRVTVTVPSVIGIDIETDVTVNLAGYLASTTATTGACPPNVFPPPAGCTGDAVYAVNVSSTTANVPAPPAANTGNIWMAVFSNRPAAPAVVLSAAVEAAWNAGSPGFATTAIRTQRSGANNVPQAGFASATNVTVAGAPIGIGTLASPFNWTRVDQLIDLAVPNGTTFTAGTFDADVTFTIAQ